MFEFINKTIPKQRKELNSGNREYKMYLDIAIESKTEQRKNKNKLNDYLHYLREQKLITKINKRASQLLYRLEEGHGKALYMIGIKDDGSVEGIEIEMLFKSINFLYKMIEIINATIKKLRIYKGSTDNKYICTARIELPKYKQKQLPII
jgi:GTPase